MNLCIGTVQFGMDYGIRNQKQPTVDEAIAILDYATQNGIDNIDTANAYGTAEDIVGNFLKKNTIARDKLFIVSKSQPNLLDDEDESKYYEIMKKNLMNSLKRLHTDYLDSYLMHSAKYVYDEAIMQSLYRLKEEGYVRHCGVSVYEPDEAKRCILYEKADFMQLPYSIFDQRMSQRGVFKLAEEKRNTQIHSRGAFVQGLVLMKEDEIPSFLAKAKPIIRKMDELCEKYKVSRTVLAMNYVKHQKAISHLVFGVDNMRQLVDNINAFNEELSKDLVMDVSKQFCDIEAEVVMPNKWKK